PAPDKTPQLDSRPLPLRQRQEIQEVLHVQARSGWSIKFRFRAAITIAVAKRAPTGTLFD
ncbi:MAG: hypothetical protein ACI8QF_004494, partial [Limisphaerales bacterium]